MCSSVQTQSSGSLFTGKLAGQLAAEVAESAEAGTAATETPSELSRARTRTQMEPTLEERDEMD